MRLIQIEYFLTVAEYKSITQASKHLCVSQPALSKQMALLEEELGIKLMYRMSWGIMLTEAGKRFEEDCRNILSELEQAKKNAIAIGASETQTLQIGCFEGAVIEDFIQPFFQYLREHFPEIKLKLSRQSIQENRNALEANRIDMLIEYMAADLNPGLQKGYSSKVLLQRKGCLIYSTASPLISVEKPTMQDFANQTLLLLNTRGNADSNRKNIKKLEAMGLNNPRLEYVENFMTFISNINIGYGYSLLTNSDLNSHSNLIGVELPDIFDLNIVAVWKEKHPFVGALMEGYK